MPKTPDARPLPGLPAITRESHSQYASEALAHQSRHYIVQMLNTFVRIQYQVPTLENGESLIQWFDAVPSIYKRRDSIRVLHNISMKSTEGRNLTGRKLLAVHSSPFKKNSWAKHALRQEKGGDRDRDGNGF